MCGKCPASLQNLHPAAMLFRLPAIADANRQNPPCKFRRDNTDSQQQTIQLHCYKTRSAPLYHVQTGESLPLSSCRLLSSPVASALTSSQDCTHIPENLWKCVSYSFSRDIASLSNIPSFSSVFPKNAPTIFAMTVFPKRRGLVIQQ